MSMSFRRSQSLRYSPYLEECRQSLAQAADHPNDRISAALVKLQAILERIHQSPWNVGSNAPGVSLPAVLLVNSVEEQLSSSEMNTLTRWIITVGQVNSDNHVCAIINCANHLYPQGQFPSITTALRLRYTRSAFQDLPGAYLQSPGRTLNKSSYFTHASRQQKAR